MSRSTAVARRVFEHFPFNTETHTQLRKDFFSGGLLLYFCEYWFENLNNVQTIAQVHFNRHIDVLSLANPQ